MKKLLLIATLTYINEIVGTRSELIIKKHPDFVGEMPAMLFCDLTEQDYELIVEKCKNGQISTITPTSVEIGYVHLCHTTGDCEVFTSPAIKITLPTSDGEADVWFNKSYPTNISNLEDIIINNEKIDSIDSEKGLQFNDLWDAALLQNWNFCGYFVDKSDLEEDEE